MVFLPGETDAQPRGVVWFLAVVDGLHLTGGRSSHALRNHCGADCDDPMPAFLAPRADSEPWTAPCLAQGQGEAAETLGRRAPDVRGLRP
jgi:hypothetical protein